VIDRMRPTRRLQKGIIILPSAFTMASLFFGFYAIVATTRGDFAWAGWFIVWAGVMDLLDGRIARFTRTGSDFGWVLPLVYVMAVVVRLARFNIEQGGEAKRHFHGLPSPTAGMILAVFYPFSQTPFFETYLATMPWPLIIGVLLVVLGALMLSNIPYALVPKLSFGTSKGILVSLWLFGNVLAAITFPAYYFFPILLAYTAWGLFGAVIHGLLERLPDRDPLEDSLEDGDDEERPVDYGELAPKGIRRPRVHLHPDDMESGT
jgi:CDP-diacylglycerol--serine O-phosphatidyltransferase